MDDEQTYWKDKALYWTDKVRSGHLTKREAWFCLNATVLKTIEYALPATTFRKKQVDSILQPILSIGLPKSGICRNISRKVVFSPPKYQGLGIRHPYIGQGISKLQTIFQANQDMTHQLFEASWVRTMIESGYGVNFLEFNIDWIFPALTFGWVVSLWEFLSEYKITLRRGDRSLARTRRHSRDTYLMQLVQTCFPKLSKTDLLQFNNCRLYLRIELLSDILTADGKAIRKSIWLGTQLNETSGFGPMQPRPSETSWNTWRRILQATLSTNGQGRCATPFPRSMITADWVWFFDESENRLYEKHQNDWRSYSVMLPARRTRHKTYGHPQECTEPGSDLLPVSTYRRGAGFAIDGYGSRVHSSIDTQTTSWWDYTCIQSSGDIDLIQEAITVGETILVVSDGSAKDGFAAAAWIITTERLFALDTYISG